MSSLPQIGPWAVSSSCAPGLVIEGMGFVLGCGGALLNTGRQPLEFYASVTPDNPPSPLLPPVLPSPQVPAPVQGLVQPGATVTLPAPPAGWSWTVAWLGRRTIRDWSIIALGVGLAVSTLTGLGIADIWRAIARRRKQRKGGR